MKPPNLWHRSSPLNPMLVSSASDPWPATRTWTACSCLGHYDKAGNILAYEVLILNAFLHRCNVTGSPWVLSMGHPKFSHRTMVLGQWAANLGTIFISFPVGRCTFHSKNWLRRLPTFLKKLFCVLWAETLDITKSCDQYLLTDWRIWGGHNCICWQGIF